MDSEKLSSLAKAWQEKCGYASCQLLFNQSVIFYQPLATAEMRSSSKSVRRVVGGTIRFFARIVPETEEVTIELQLGTEKLASYELSDARGLIDSETIYS